MICSCLAAPDAGCRHDDLGRRRRLFTGSAREAALLQAFLREPGGPTNVANSDPYCGTHDRLKEHGFRPVRDPDGTWTIYRPDGQPITPAA